MKILRSCAIFLAVAVALASVPALAATDPFSGAKDAACQGVQFSETGSCGSGTASVNKLDKAIELAVNILSAIVAIAAVIMIIVGGFKYITSQGDNGQISSAKNTILYAIIGLVIASLAQVLVQFVLFKV